MTMDFYVKRIASVIRVTFIGAVLCLACAHDSPVDGNGPSIKDRPCFDFANHLHTVTLLETPHAATAVAVANGMAYVATGETGLEIVDVRDPSMPVLRGRVDTTGTVRDVVAVGSVAYVAFGSSGLVVVDGGDPDRPIIVGRVRTPGQAHGIAVRDTVAYVADDVVGLMLFGVSDPTLPTPMGVENSAGRAVDVAVDGAMVYVADEVLGLRVVNASDSWSPWLVNSVPMPGTSQGVAASKGVVYVATGSTGLQAVDVSTVGGETIVGSLEIEGSARALSIAEDVVFVASGLSGLTVVDVAAPSRPTAVNRVVGNGDMGGVASDGGFVYVAEGSEGLRVVDAMNPLPPPRLASLEDPSSDTITLVDAETSAAFATGTSMGLFGVELDGSAMTLTGSTVLPFDDIEDLVVRDGVVYVAAGMDGIHMFDVSDPGTITPMGKVPYDGNVEAVELRDSLVYFVTGGETFGVYRLGENAPSTVDIARAATTAVGVSGDYAYVGSRNRQRHVVSVANPDAPSSLGTGPLEGSGVEVFAGAEYVYYVTSNEFAGGENGVAVYDVTLPFQPLFAAFLRLSGGPVDRPVDAAMWVGTLYLAQGRGGLQVIDVSDPLNPTRIGSIASDGATTGVAAVAGAVFVADGTGGLFSVPTQQCETSP
jgi:hypothetical protein